MKKIALTMMALLTMTVAVAQDNEKGERKPHRQMTPEMMTERMAKDLNLTDAQKTKVLALNKEYQEIFKGPRMGRPRPPRPQADAETSATQQQRPERPQLTDEQKAQMKEQMEKREAYNNKLKEVLNDEQYQTYEKMHQRQGRRGHRGPGGPHPGGPRGPRPDRAPQQ